MDFLELSYLAFILVVFLVVALIDLAPYLRKKVKTEYNLNYNPKTLVMVPCRGEDLTLKENLKSLANQGYDNYDLIAIVDGEDDPAVKCIRTVGISYLLSDYKTGKASGKVQAIITAIRKFKNYDTYVIADSDILVKKDWLRKLIAPLQDKKIGISTTFPKFVARAGLWSKVKFVWGFAGEGMMENNATRFGWGGSLAFRKDLINKNTMHLLTKSTYSVSDDIALTKAAKLAGLGITYVKGAQPIVNSDDSFFKFIEWSNRQTALSVLGYKRNLYYGIAFYSAEILLFVSGIVLSYLITPLFLILLAHFLKSELRTAARAKSSDPAIAFIVIFMPIIYLANLLVASSTSHITWRGRRYAIRG